MVGIRAWPPLTRWRGVRMHGGIRRWGRVRTCLSNSNPTDQNASELSSNPIDVPLIYVGGGVRAVDGEELGEAFDVAAVLQ